MKAPKKPVVRKSDVASVGTNIGFDQLAQLYNSSMEVTNSYMEYKKDAEKTKRVHIEGQKEIILGEQELEKAHMQHKERLEELSQSKQNSLQDHERGLRKISQDDRRLDMEETRQNKIFAKLEAGEITPEMATLLLYGKQE